MAKITIKKQIGIITGATGGFGIEFLKILIKNETLDEIWALSKNEEKLLNVQKTFGPKVRIFAVDLSDSKNIEAFSKNLSNNITIKYLINNAGFAKFCSYKELSLEQSLQMIDVNIKAVVAMTICCYPFMQEKSHIINIASQAAFQPLPYMNIYSASKAFVRNYTRALNVELKPSGITATAVCPGWMKTKFFEVAEMGAEKTISNFKGILSPHTVAEKAIKDANKGKDTSVCSIKIKFLHFFAKVLPQSISMKIWNLMQNL